VETPTEADPVVVGDRTAGELVTGLAGEVPVFLVVKVVEGGGHDAAFGEQMRPGQVEQSRQQLASGQVAGSPEEHDHVRGQRGMGLGHRGGPMKAGERVMACSYPGPGRRETHVRGGR
jgi:hypothetical protein